MKCLLKRKVDILTITDNKLDSSFATAQFLIDDYSKLLRFDRNRNGSGVLLYVREDIAFRELKSDNFPNHIEGIFIELNLRKVKWLLFSRHHPPSQFGNYYFSHVSNCLNTFCSMFQISSIFLDCRF